MKKYLFIVLSVSFGWGQVEEGISYYESGLQVGNWNTWYMNGQKSIEGSYKHNERNGEWTFYKEDGTVYEVKEY